MEKSINHVFDDIGFSGSRGINRGGFKLVRGNGFMVRLVTKKLNMRHNINYYRIPQVVV